MKSIALAAFFFLIAACSSNPVRKVASDLSGITSGCFKNIAIDNKWPEITPKQAECLKTYSNFELDLKQLCTDEMSDYSVSYKAYLHYKAEYGKAQDAYRAATDDIVRARIDRKLNDILQDWDIEGCRGLCGRSLDTVISAHDFCVSR